MPREIERYRWDGDDPQSSQKRLSDDDHRRQVEREDAEREHEWRMQELHFNHLETMKKTELEIERMKLEALKVQAETDNAHQLSLKEAESRLRIDEAKDIQPIELQKLLIQEMGQYGRLREKALDEAIRNPVLRDQLRAKAQGYQDMQSITRETIDGFMSLDIPVEAKRTLVTEYLKRMGQHTDEYLKKLFP